MMISSSTSSSPRTVAVFILFIANLYVVANAAEEASLETPLSGLLGGDIDGLAQSDNFGSALATSADGNRIVVGAQNHDASEQGTNYYDIGSVRVFEYGTSMNPPGWSQVGGEIDGVAQSDYFGGAVASSSDGNSFVARTRENRYASMFKYGTPANLTGWAQAGYALNININYYSMYSSEAPPFAASSDCKRIVVPTSFGMGVFEYGTAANLTGWSQVGATITGGNNEEFGSALTISADGNHIVIGARRGDVLGSADNYFGTFNDVGFVRMMQYGSAASPTDWTQIGVDVFGEAQNDLFGSSVALSGDAKRVAVGAPNNDPSVQDAGHVRVLATACVEDAYVSAGTCTSCAPGSTNEAGDVLTEVDTVCDVALCAAYERVSNHTCVLCLPGTLNAPGDDPTGDDTDCDYFQKSTTNSTNSCAAYEHVVSGACVPCSPGSSNAPGDDPTSDDTDCDPLICGENYRVSSHGCLACESGVYNMAGDDASGEDTECDGFPSGWSDQGNYQGTNQPLVPSSDYSSATRSFRVGLGRFGVAALLVASLEVIDYAHRFCINIGCREP